MQNLHYNKNKHTNTKYAIIAIPAVLLLAAIVPTVFLQPVAFAQSNGIDWNQICNTASQTGLIMQSCSDLVNSDGTLTSAGDTAVGCIRNGLILGLGALHLGVPLPIVLGGLQAGADGTGCGGIVDLNGIHSLGQLMSVAHSFGV